VEAVAARVPAGAAATAADFERLADRFLRSHKLVPLIDAGDASEPGAVFVRRDGRVMPVDPAELRFSTRELLAIERRLLDRAQVGRGAGAAVVEESAVVTVLRSRPSLSAEQVRMIRSLTMDGDRVAVVVGRAGTGKTFALGACGDAWRSDERCVIGAAVARRAARELEQQAGIPSTSVAALLGGVDRLPAGAVLVVDEAGMVGTRDLARLLDAVHATDGKLVLVGDHRQLPSIDAGGAFHALARRLDAVELSDNRRQVHAWERTAVELLRAGDGPAAVELYRQHERFHVERDGNAARERLVRDWCEAADPQQSVMIALRRADVDALNALAHERTRSAGLLTGPEFELPGGRFAAGDLILLRRNDLRLGLCNGDRGRVMRIDDASRSLDVEIGDRRLTLPWHYVVGRTERGDPAVTHGYALTGHTAQGLTVNRAFVLADCALTREWAYVAMTRGREANHLYLAEREELARDEFGPADGDSPSAVERLARNLSVSRVDSLALDGAADVMTDLERQREELRRSLASALRERVEQEDSPLRWLRRGPLMVARERERALADELGIVDRKLDKATKELQRARQPEDLLARSLVREIDRRQDIQRERTVERGRSSGL
jgi:hypothetical protein